jgi:hypothetical protein
MTAHFPGLLQALHIHDRSFPWLATGTSYTLPLIFLACYRHFIYITAHFHGLLQALDIHDRSFPWLATDTSYT